jgi:hypothetical protein
MSSFSDIPADLRCIPRWVLWRWFRRDDGEPGKLPIRIRGANASVFDQGNQMDFDEARIQLSQTSAAAGLGFVFDEPTGLGGIDLDGCLCPRTGALAGWAREVVEQFPGTYTEVTPSGAGLRIFASGAPLRLPRCSRAMERAEGDPVIEGKTPFLEAFVRRRFLTITGNRWNDAPSRIANLPAAWEWLVGVLVPGRLDPGHQRPTRDHPEVDLTVVADALSAFTSDDVDRNTWVGIGAALKSTFGEDAFETYAAWMAQSPWDDAEGTAALWDSLTEAHSMTVGTIFWLARQHGWERPLQLVHPYEGAEVVDESSRYESTEMTDD